MHSNASFLDANVILEAILQDRKYSGKAKQYLQKYNAVISPLSAHLVVYFGQKDGIEFDALLNLISFHLVTDLGPSEIAWAKKYHEAEDFEDALQVACAVMSGCKEFVTFDKKLAGLYGKYIKMKLL